MFGIQKVEAGEQFYAGRYALRHGLIFLRGRLRGFGYVGWYLWLPIISWRRARRFRAENTRYLVHWTRITTPKFTKDVTPSSSPWPPRH